MSLTRDQIKDAAMQLDPAEREALAEELLLSIDGVEREAIDAAWLAEAHRREASFVAGTTGAKPVDEVIRRLRSKTSK
jgi:putative addiction module component (TIGR02574 family)